MTAGDGAVGPQPVVLGVQIQGTVEVGAAGGIQLPLPGEDLLGAGLGARETEQRSGHYQKPGFLHQNPPNERVIQYNLMKGPESAGVPRPGAAVAPFRFLNIFTRWAV